MARRPGEDKLGDFVACGVTDDVVRVAWERRFDNWLVVNTHTRIAVPKKGPNNVPAPSRHTGVTMVGGAWFLARSNFRRPLHISPGRADPRSDSPGLTMDEYSAGQSEPVLLQVRFASCAAPSP